MLVRLCVLGVLPVEADDPNGAIEPLERQLFNRAEREALPNSEFPHRLRYTDVASLRAVTEPRGELNGSTEEITTA